MSFATQYAPPADLDVTGYIRRIVDEEMRRRNKILDHLIRLMFTEDLEYRGIRIDAPRSDPWSWNAYFSEDVPWGEVQEHV